MDKYKALEYEKLFKTHLIDGYRLDSILGFGKSAVVFKGVKDDLFSAIKIFDDELVEKYGVEIQEKRIKHELSLKNHKIKNLVNILGGGNYPLNERYFHYIIMEYFEGETLKDYIKREGAQEEKFCKNVFQFLFDICNELIKMDIAHRDIKPENIMIHGNNLMLMDLGVIKIINHENITDDELSKPFIGTLRYAPPEFLFRDEKDNTDSWEAINIYQIGGVLHDLIMGKELFHQYKEPYASLVLAVKEEVPTISRVDFSFNFLKLVRNLLLKNPENRLKCFREIDIDKISNQLDNSEASNLINDIKIMTDDYNTKMEEVKFKSQELLNLRKKVLEFHNKILISLDNSWKYLKEHDLFDNVEMINQRKDNKYDHFYILYKLSGDLNKGFSNSYYIIIELIIEIPEYIKSSIISIIGNHPNEGDILKIFKDRNNYNKKITFFEGAFDNESFTQYYHKYFLLLHKKSLEYMRPFVEAEIKNRKDNIGKKINFFISISSKAKIIDSIN